MVMTKMAGYIKRLIAEGKLDCKKIEGRPTVSRWIKRVCAGQRAVKTIQQKFRAKRKKVETIPDEPPSPPPSPPKAKPKKIKVTIGKEKPKEKPKETPKKFTVEIKKEIEKQKDSESSNKYSTVVDYDVDSQILFKDGVAFLDLTETKRLMVIFSVSRASEYVKGLEELKPKTGDFYIFDKDEDDDDGAFLDTFKKVGNMGALSVKEKTEIVNDMKRNFVYELRVKYKPGFTDFKVELRRAGYNPPD